MTNDNDQDRDQEDSTLTLAKENSDIGQEEDVYFSRLRSILERSKQRQVIFWNTILISSKDGESRKGRDV